MILKYFLCLLVFTIFIVNLFGQNEISTLKSPFTFEASYNGDLFINTTGGIKRGACYLGKANLQISFDTEDAKFWKGGQLFINGANTHGSDPTADLAGDFQGVSNVETGNWTYLYELWYRQTFGNLSVTIGLQDLNSEFASSKNAGLFLNGSFGIHSTIADNLPSPIFPLTAFGAQLQYRLSNKITAKVIVFDGCPDDLEKNPHNLKWDIKKEDGLLSVYELTFNDSIFKNMPGTFKIGSYFHNHITVINQETENQEVSNNYGFYMVADQLIYKNLKGQQISLFTQASMSPYQKNDNWYYVGLGCNFQGLFKKRMDDIVGFAIAHAGFKNKIYSHETTFEMEYKAQLNDNLFLQPGVQYIIHPSGTSARLDNALLTSFRIGFNF